MKHINEFNRFQFFIPIFEIIIICNDKIDHRLTWSLCALRAGVQQRGGRGSAAAAGLAQKTAGNSADSAASFYSQNSPGNNILLEYTSIFHPLTKILHTVVYD